MRWTHLFRSSSHHHTAEETEERDPVAMMHGELCYVLTRMRVKLAATIPPPSETLALAITVTLIICTIVSVCT